MLALRSFARALPRVSTRLPVTRITPRFVQPSAIFKQPTFKAFSTTVIRKDAAGESDQLLSAKIGHERQLELDERDPTVLPQSVEDFLSSSDFKAVDSEGTQIVTLTKQVGAETIKVEFNIADMNQIDEEFDDSMDEDTALEDEEYTTQGKRTINQSGVKGGKVDVAPEDKLSPADGEAEFDEDDAYDTTYPIGLNITISKPGAGATYIRARAEDGAIEIENVNYFADASLIQPETPDQVRAAQAVYEGPPFMNLDQELQTMLYTYLEERGIDAQLASFLPEYVDYKEQKEYVQWLANMKKFIDA